MTTVLILYLWLTSVTPSPGWSTPVLVTEETNNKRAVLFLHMDEQSRFHLVWAGYKDENRIAYKMFDINGSSIIPDTMISRNTASAYLTTMATGDSLYAFWREYSPVYYSVRSLTDGSEIVPATYLFTTSTLYPYIRACPDSLGRLHVIYNEGSDVRYAVWTPAPGSGFITERDWKIEGAHACGELLVDGNRVHIVVQDSVSHTYEYLQYDLDGNTVIPLIDFTADDIYVSRDPALALDVSGNLMVLEDVDPDYILWKLDKTSGFLLVDEKTIVSDSYPEMMISTRFTLRNLPGTDLFYLVWSDGSVDDQILFLLMNSNGDVIVDWAIAYDYADEDPEDIRCIDGVVDADGNLFLAYEQVETDPVLGYFPTFGWFNYDYVNIQNSSAAVIPVNGVSFSCNPVHGSVSISTAGTASRELRVYDISGRDVSSVSITNGTGIWNGTDYSGARLPSGIYNITDNSCFIRRITLLGR